MRKRTKKRGGAIESLKTAGKFAVDAVSSDQTCNFDRNDAPPNQNTQKVREAVLKSKFISKDGSEFGAFLQNQMKVLCDKEDKGVSIKSDKSDKIAIRKTRLNLCENMLKCIKSPKELIYVLYDIFHKESKVGKVKEKYKDSEQTTGTGGDDYGGPGEVDLMGGAEGMEEEEEEPEEKTEQTPFEERNIASFVIFFCNILVVSLKNYYNKKKDNPNFKVGDIKVLTDLNTELKKIFKDIPPILDPNGNVNPMFKSMDDKDIQQHPFYAFILKNKSTIDKKYEERMEKEASGAYDKERDEDDTEPVGNPSLFGGIVMFFLGMAFLIEYSGFTPKK